MKSKVDLFLSVCSLLFLLIGIYAYWFTEDEMSGVYMIAMAGVVKP